MADFEMTFVFISPLILSILFRHVVTVHICARHALITIARVLLIVRILCVVTNRLISSSAAVR